MRLTNNPFFFENMEVVNLFGSSGQNSKINKFDFLHFGIKQKKKKLLLLQLTALLKKHRKHQNQRLRKRQHLTGITGSISSE